MNDPLLLLSCLVVGALLGAGIGFLLSRLMAQRGSVESEGTAKANAERLKDREMELTELKARMSKAEQEAKAVADASQKRFEDLAERLRIAEAAKARIEGAGESIEALKEQIASKDEELQGYVQRVTKLSTDLRQAQTEADQAKRTKEELLEQKDVSVRGLLKAKDEECLRIVAERTEALESQRREMEASVAAQLAEKDRSMESLRQSVQAQLEEKDRAISTIRETAASQLQVKDSALASQLAAKDEECARLISEKERALQAQRKAVEESAAAQIAEKDRAIAAIEEATKRQLQEKDRAIEDQKRLLQKAEEVLTEKFSSVSVESLKKATDEFLKLASQTFDKTAEQAKGDLEKRQQAIDELLKPVKETLDKMDRQNQEMEQKRVSAFDQIVKGIETLSSEADQLANALRKPQARGAWGEMQLQVILENAGLLEGEHFVLQDSTEGEDGRQRTDVVIKLPKDRLIVIDSKAPLDSYWDGMNAADEATRLAKFAIHAKRVREHVKQLSSKAYWDRYKGTPDCVVMFLATEGAYQAAVEADPALITDAHKSRVYLANPMTIMSMVHVAAYVLREERLREDAYKVQEVGAELYERLRVFTKHFASIGRNLDLTVRDYNQAVGSLDGRVIQQARRMRQLGAGKGEELPTPKIVESSVRPITSADLRELPPLAAVDLEAPALNGQSAETDVEGGVR